MCEPFIIELKQHILCRKKSGVGETFVEFWKKMLTSGVSALFVKICLYSPPFSIDLHQNGLSLGHALLGLSPSAPPGPREGDLATHDTVHETKRASTEKG